MFHGGFSTLGENMSPESQEDDFKNGLRLPNPTLPWIREATFGSTLGSRAKAMEGLAAGINQGQGPSDLVHWGRHYGEKSSKVMNNRFELKSSQMNSKVEEGYIGYFHYLNGLDFSMGAQRIEEYVTRGIGLMKSDDAYHWQPQIDFYSLGSYHEKQMVVTLCSYNCFSRSEMRARFLISVPKSHKSPIPVDASFTIYSHLSSKMHSYNETNISEVSHNFWDELAVSSLIRLCLATDDPAHLLCGTVNIPDQIKCKWDVKSSISRLISVLHKGCLSGALPRFGVPSSCGADFVKTSRYRNRVIDTLVRIVALDSTSKMAKYAIKKIQECYGEDFDIVVCRLLRADFSCNNDIKFLQLVHANLTKNSQGKGFTGHVRNEVDETRKFTNEIEDKFEVRNSSDREQKIDGRMEIEGEKRCHHNQKEHPVKAQSTRLSQNTYHVDKQHNGNTLISEDKQSNDKIHKINDHQITDSKSPKPSHSLSCQNALLLIEQARFLLSRKSYGLATKAAARAVSVLPLDFDAWHTLALCYIMTGEYSEALETMNAFPISFSSRNLEDNAEVDGVSDSFAVTFAERAAQNKALDLRTFESFFPVPKVEPDSYSGKKHGTDMASIGTIWHEQFLIQRHMRHPLCGPFYRSPLFFATNLELAAVDQRIIKLAGPGATKLAFAAQSAGEPWSSILDFDTKSTWGRTYDLLTLMSARVGWDDLVHIKNATFRGKASFQEEKGDFIVDQKSLRASSVKQWFQQLFLVVFDDLHGMVQMSNYDHDRSALSWGMLGIMGWACKYNLKDNLSAIHTSLAGSSAHSGFDYFGTVKMLQIYTEYVLSDVCASTIDPYSNVYDGRLYTSKLIVQNSSAEVYDKFVHQLENGYFSLNFVLLCLVKLVSWNVRWYNYMPNFLVTDTLLKLCTKYDALVIRSRLQILMKSLVKKKAKAPPAAFTLKSMFAAPQVEQQSFHEFVDSDTIMVYMEELLCWLEEIASDG